MEDFAEVHEATAEDSGWAVALAATTTELEEHRVALAATTTELEEHRVALAATTTELEEHRVALAATTTELEEQRVALAATTTELEEHRADPESLVDDLESKERLLGQTSMLLLESSTTGLGRLARRWLDFETRHRRASDWIARPVSAAKLVVTLRWPPFIRPSPMFDAAWYARQYPDAAGHKGGLWWHYWRHGSREGRDPNAYFDADWYSQTYPDVAESNLSPADHYLRHGGFEGRDPSPLFDSAWYLRRNPDVVAAGQNPLVHYLRFGVQEGRAPTPPAAPKAVVTAPTGDAVLQSGREPIHDPTDLGPLAVSAPPRGLRAALPTLGDMEQVRIYYRRHGWRRLAARTRQELLARARRISAPPVGFPRPAIDRSAICRAGPRR